MTVESTAAAQPAPPGPETQAFMERMIGVLNSAGTALMLSIGHRTGLFDTMADMQPATSRQVAQWAGLNERYVREWLGAMVSAEIVDFDPALQTYHLPPARAAALTRSATPNNMAGPMQWFAVLGQVEDQIIECFRRGGGVPYSAYDRFHEVMAEESAQTVVAVLIDQILPLVPSANERLKRGIDVLDVGCGSGRALLRMAEAFPQSRFAGYDFSEEAIAAGRAEAEKRSLRNVRFEARDAANLAQQDAFDLVTAFDAIHDQAQPAKVLREIYNVLRSDGTFLMQDIDASTNVEKNIPRPLGALLYTISCMHCMTVSLAQGGAGLGACWGEELAREMLADAGFKVQKVERLPHDIINCYYVATKS